MMTRAVKSKHRKKEGVRGGGRNGRRTKKLAVSVASVAVGLTFTRGGEGGRREKDFLCRFAAETNCRLPHFHDLYKSRHLTPSRRLESQSPPPRGRRGGSNFYDTVIILQCRGSKQNAASPLCQPTVYPISCTLQIPSRTLH